jgi:hypothetical protein
MWNLAMQAWKNKKEKHKNFRMFSGGSHLLFIKSNIKLKEWTSLKQNNLKILKNLILRKVPSKSIDNGAYKAYSTKTYKAERS